MRARGPQKPCKESATLSGPQLSSPASSLAHFHAVICGSCAPVGCMTPRLARSHFAARIARDGFHRLWRRHSAGAPYPSPAQPALSRLRKQTLPQSEMHNSVKHYRCKQPFTDSKNHRKDVRTVKPEPMQQKHPRNMRAQAASGTPLLEILRIPTDRPFQRQQQYVISACAAASWQHHGARDGCAPPTNSAYALVLK